MAEECKNKEENSTSDAVSEQSNVFLCQPCSRKDSITEADVFCSSCDELQCTKCSNIHDVYVFMKNHRLLHVRELASFHMKGLDQCDQHQELFKFFCEDENRLCCSTCAIVNHRNCQSVVEIQTMTEQFCSTSSTLKTKLEEVKSEAESAIKQTQSLQDQLRHKIEELPKKIAFMQEEVNEMFENLKSSATKDVKSFQTKTEAKLTTKQSSSKGHIAEVTKSLETIDNVYQNGTLSQWFIVEHNLKDKVNKLDMDVEKSCQDLETVTVSFDFDEALKLPPSLTADYIPGQLTLTCNIPDISKSAAHEGPTCIMKLEKITSIDLKQTGDDAFEPFYSGLDFLPDGRLVAMDNRNKKCLIFNEKLEKVGWFLLPFLPASVVAVSEEELTVTSGLYTMHVLRVSKSNEITRPRSYQVKTKYTSICMKDDNNFVVGTIDNARHVRIVSLSGEEKNFNINFPNKRYAVGTSACTYIKNSGKVVLTDKEEHAVYIYDVATNTRVVVQDDKIKEPRGVAVGPSDCIFVCSKDTNSLVQITSAGQVLTSQKLDMIYPRIVSICQGLSILALTNSCMGKRKLQLYKLN